MKRELEIRKPARADMTDAAKWYEKQTKGMGVKFLRELESCLASIKRSPERASLVHPRVRRALLHRFPYGVFYVVDERRIRVIACLHVRREPATWKSRT
ncbi:type II toxin-antitoxin system RelE/ParE family toxin [Hyalangium versicolor]|uniref:type II toxin-antitoxin system RelE/ParE family toxin n=1 Tax=Hyalangium versicolor TaxID=2861190 RepID=UPI001CCE8C45|nr:type II toxin-antitoxin system RelE/ParE family toxin [Hyalangium versicolor]